MRELQKYLSIDFCLLLGCEQDEVARLCAKVAMKGHGRGKKRLQHNIVDLFPDIPTVPNR